MLETGRTVSQRGGAEPANVAQPCEPTPKRIVWRGDEIAKGRAGRPCSLELEHLNQPLVHPCMHMKIDQALVHCSNEQLSCYGQDPTGVSDLSRDGITIHGKTGAAHVAKVFIQCLTLR